MNHIASTLIFLTAEAQGTNPVTLQMLAPAVDVGAIVRGFSACSVVEALPKRQFEPLGVKFLGAGAAPRFADPKLLGDGSSVQLVGNDPANLERAGNGAFLTYGGAYKLRAPFRLTNRLSVVGVKATTMAFAPRGIASVTYVFNISPTAAAVLMNAVYGAAIDPTVAQQEAVARGRSVWYVADEAGRSLTCYRYLARTTAG